MRRVSIALLCTVSSLILPRMDAAAQDLPGCKYTEHWETSTPASGGQLVGFLLGIDSSSIRHDALYVYVAGVTDVQGICTNLRSDNLRYSGQSHCKAPKDPGWYRVPVPTKDVKALEAFRSEQIGVVARAAASCDGPSDEEPMLYPVAWGMGSRKWSTASVLLNTRGIEPRIIVTAPSSPKDLGLRSGCRPFAGNASLYDYRCDVNLPSETDLAADVRLQRGRSVTHITLRTRVP
jgi:hypothetical protein